MAAAPPIGMAEVDWVGTQDEERVWWGKLWPWVTRVVAGMPVPLW